MNTSEIAREFKALSHASRIGDAEAALRFDSVFGDGLMRFVRRVLRRGHGRGYLADYVLDEAARIRSQSDAVSQDNVVSEISERISSLVTGQGIGHRVDTVHLNGEATVTAV